VKQAERALAHDAYERERTDPWRFYCRLCGAEGEYPDEGERNAASLSHIRGCGTGATTRSESCGRLQHVWRY
jgi:hypothetical protein